MTQPTQLPKRPELWGAWDRQRGHHDTYKADEADAMFDAQDAKIAELEKELRVIRSALGKYADDTGISLDRYIEAARKESNDGE